MTEYLYITNYFVSIFIILFLIHLLFKGLILVFYHLDGLYCLSIILNTLYSYQSIS